ncbi:MAG: amidohydrolase [Saprospiraceae bacterium]
MRLTLIQTSLLWENPTANREALARHLAPLSGETDLILLPEMFTTGFSMDAARLAEPADGPTLQWMREQAQRSAAAVGGSVMCAESGRFFNRFYFVKPDGEALSYDKRHLFGLAGETERYTRGERRLVVEWRGVRICPLICYDLRFPVWSRNSASDPYDLLVYVANWPEARSAHWRALLVARAIENQCYTAGVNIIGADGNGLNHVGDSALIDYSGAAIWTLHGQPGAATLRIDLDALRQWRKRLPFLESDEWSG